MYSSTLVITHPSDSSLSISIRWISRIFCSVGVQCTEEETWWCEGVGWVWGLAGDVWTPCVTLPSFLLRWPVARPLVTRLWLPPQQLLHRQTTRWKNYILFVDSHSWESGHLVSASCVIHGVPAILNRGSHCTERLCSIVSSKPWQWTWGFISVKFSVLSFIVRLR